MTVSAGDEEHGDDVTSGPLDGDRPQLSDQAVARLLAMMREHRPPTWRQRLAGWYWLARGRLR